MAFERTKSWARASETMWTEFSGLGKTLAVGSSVLYGMYNILDYVSSTPLAVTATILATEALASTGIIPPGLGMTTFLAQHGVVPDMVNAIQNVTAETAVAGVGAHVLRRSAMRFIPHAGEFLGGMKDMASNDFPRYRRRY